MAPHTTANRSSTWAELWFRDVGRSHCKTTLIYQWQVSIFVDTTCSHPAQRKCCRIIGRTSLPEFFGPPGHTHTHLANLNTSCRDKGFARIPHLLSQTATENKILRKRTQNCKLASWANEDIKSHVNEPFKTKRIHHEALQSMFFPTVLKEMHVPSKMHHQVSLQTKLPLNFPVLSPKIHEHPLLLKKNVQKKSICGSAEKPKRQSPLILTSAP